MSSTTPFKPLKFFKSIAAAAVIGTSLITANPAEARTGECYENTRGATICILAVHGHKTDPNRRFVKSAVNGNVSWDNVYCNPSHRHNYKDNLFGKACFEYSY